jgi:tetratricopeptide (TPR) repeat protein
LHRRKDYAASERAFRRALDLFEETGLGEEPPALEAMRSLANELSMLGDNGAAEQLYRRVADITRARWGDAHPDIGAIEFNLGLSARDAGQNEAALAHFERALAIKEPVFGRDSERLGSLYMMIADMRQQLGDAAGARPFAERAYRISLQLPENHSERANATMVLARIEIFTGNPRAAIARFEEVLSLGIDSAPVMAPIERSLAVLYCDVHETANARPHAERAAALAPTGAQELREQIAVVRARIARDCID